jgi:hypothetical protein
MKLSATTFLALSLLTLAACERKTIVIEVPPATPMPEPVSRTETMETHRLDAAVDAFDRNPTAENLADAKKAFAKLDGEIAELEAYVAKHTGSERAEAAAKLHNLTAYRTAETARFTAAQAKAPLTRTAPDSRTGAEKVEDSARRAGNAIEDAAKNVGDAVKDAVR